VLIGTLTQVSFDAMMIDPNSHARKKEKRGEVKREYGRI